jgi:MFS family permease
MSLMAVHAFLAMGGIAGPFGPAYCLRDVGLSFVGLGLLNAVATATALASSPFWGRMVDRLGCRPILILGLAILAPCSAVWIGIPPGAVTRAYWLLPFGNVVGGAASAAVGVAISAMLYKASQPVGRSVQFAVYGSVITAVGAPMPLVGGWLVSRLQGAGVAVDLRLTFALWSAFMALAALMAVRLRERRSVHTRVILFTYIPYRLASLLGIPLPTFLVPTLGLDAARPKVVGDGPREQAGKNPWQGPSDSTRMDVRE